MRCVSGSPKKRNGPRELARRLRRGFKSRIAEREPMATGQRETSDLGWPRKHDLFGVMVSATCYDEAVEVISRAAINRSGGAITALAVHGLVHSSRDAMMRRATNSFDMVVPDGQPVRFALN